MQNGASPLDLGIQQVSVRESGQSSRLLDTRHAEEGGAVNIPSGLKHSQCTSRPPRWKAVFGTNHAAPAVTFR